MGIDVHQMTTSTSLFFYQGGMAICHRDSTPSQSAHMRMKWAEHMYMALFRPRWKPMRCKRQTQLGYQYRPQSDRSST